MLVKFWKIGTPVKILQSGLKGNVNALIIIDNNGTVLYEIVATIEDRRIYDNYKDFELEFDKRSKDSLEIDIGPISNQ